VVATGSVLDHRVPDDQLPERCLDTQIRGHPHGGIEVQLIHELILQFPEVGILGGFGPGVGKAAQAPHRVSAVDGLQSREVRHEDVVGLDRAVAPDHEEQIAGGRGEASPAGGQAPPVTDVLDIVVLQLESGVLER
jgi:hypothetical protein